MTGNSDVTLLGKGCRPTTNCKILSDADSRRCPILVHYFAEQILDSGTLTDP